MKATFPRRKTRARSAKIDKSLVDVSAAEKRLSKPGRIRKIQFVRDTLPGFQLKFKFDDLPHARAKIESN